MLVTLTIYPVENQTLYEIIIVRSWESLLAQLDSAYGNNAVQAVGLDVCCESCEHVSQSVHIELDRIRYALTDEGLRAEAIAEPPSGIELDLAIGEAEIAKEEQDEIGTD